MNGLRMNSIPKRGSAVTRNEWERIGSHKVITDEIGRALDCSVYLMNQSAISIARHSVIDDDRKISRHLLLKKG
jgi:hypothetical protein